MTGKVIPALVLTSLVLFVYGQVGDFDFVIYDDPHYVQTNPHVNRGFTTAGLKWAFLTFHGANWHPLTWLSLMLDGSLYGSFAGGYHWTNVLFHLASVLLLFYFLVGVTGALWRSFFVAALFGVHPLHVESVAWVSERKDVLSGFFWMLVLVFYGRYALVSSLGRYFWVVLFFLLGLMSKPMLVTLPFVLLLLDYWPLGRFGGAAVTVFPRVSPRVLVMEKIPLFILSLLSSIVTLYAQKAGGALKTIGTLPLSDRINNAVVSYAAYLAKTFWPADLTLLYPHPGTQPLGLFLVSSAFLVVACLLVGMTGRKLPYLVTGWLWYMVTLVPVIGIIQVGNQAMADRYTYLPLVGIFIAVVWLGADLAKRAEGRRLVFIAVGLAVIVALVFAARLQASHWRDTETLFTRSIALTRGNYEAMNNLGVFYFNKGRYREAAQILEKAVSTNPRFAPAYNNLGQAYAALGDTDGAIAVFRRGLTIDPGLVKMKRNLANTHLLRGECIQAAGLYREIVAFYPGDADLWNDLGVALAGTGRRTEAANCFQEALRLNPGHVAARHNLERIEAPKDRPAEHGDSHGRL
ncbi:MAG TPA: tetratricopeptide repeat protein [Syntrophales bacterium]|nr:tetratricopeptide repeat protein [Syntrophales bacterium]HOM08121.1 tetratricopeptide repeat protein [Syntrophales bacterium]